MSKHTSPSLRKVNLPIARKLAELALELPPGTTLTSHESSWEEYKELMNELVDVRSRRISYDEGVLEIMSVSPRHEAYASLLERLITLVGFILRIKILFYGSSTISKMKVEKGNESDACFYIQSANLLPNKLDIDFEHDPPPDIAVEVDVHHKSSGKLHIYAALRVPEVWLYDQTTLTIFHLKSRKYVEAEASQALPFLTAAKLTEFLNLSQQEDQAEVLLAFEKWLRRIKKESKKSSKK
jgi:Uma2 family endonuclease